MLHFVSVVWGSLERSFPAFFRSENIQGDAPMAHTQNAQRDASASSSHVPHESATGNAGDDLVPVQQPLSPKTENLKEMLSRLDQIKSIQDMLKAMNDGHGLGQRVRNETVRDD